MDKSIPKTVQDIVKTRENELIRRELGISGVARRKRNYTDVALFLRAISQQSADFPMAKKTRMTHIQ